MGAGLTDMEELSARVADPGMADYVREAMTCYSVGANRACIVLTCNALFEDLRQKVRVLSSVSSDAKKISDDIELLAQDQKPYESTLVDRLASKSIITTLQSQRLKQLIDHRNKAAHPSGLHASAEEARFVFFEAIDKFLSAPILSSTQHVDLLLQRMAGANYFPDRSVTNINAVVAAEVREIHPLTYPYLILKLVQLCKSISADIQRNGRFFLTGMAGLNQEAIREALDKHLIVKEAHDLLMWETLAAPLAVDPRLLLTSDGATKLRLAKLLVHIVASTESGLAVTILRHPLHLLNQMTSELSTAELLPFHEFADAVIEAYWHNPQIVGSLKKSGRIRSKIMEALISRAGSSTYDVANRLARAIPEFDAELSTYISDEEAFRLLSSIQQAANWGAWGASAVQSDTYNQIPTLKKKAFEFMQLDEVAAEAIAKEYSGADFDGLKAQLSSGR
ncbi:hypothetical protein [Rhizobium sp. ZW T2_16]|uniref:hypothetical protein n=1 Tax=Rhizobium sp. ZW T2_16 TaxID=3378083 RepID=UPI003851F9A5